MTMCEPSQPTFFDGMELPLMSSREAFRARTLALLESSAAWVKEPVPVSGPRSSDLLASYDHNSSSWRTSQRCLLAQANGEADGLAEFSETWPSAGMMRNGKTFRRQPWALPIAESASGLWPTPCKVDGDFYNSQVQTSCDRSLQVGRQMQVPQIWQSGTGKRFAPPHLSAWLMGYDQAWMQVSFTLSETA